MKLVKFVVLVAGGMFAWISAGSAQSLQPGATWTSQRGSTLTIEAVAADGSFTGSYINRATALPCPNSPFKVSGWIDGQKISFSVRWRNATNDCHSITSWTGYLSDRLIATEFALVYVNRQGKTAFSNGKDTFH